MSKSRMQLAARQGAAALLAAGKGQRLWTPAMRRLWTRAFNALNALAEGKVGKRASG